MSETSRREVRLLFQRVTEMDPEAARCLLEEVRIRSPQVVAEVESLLQARSLGANLFGSTSSMFESGAAEEPELSAGELILHYRLLEKVGAGATGTVWKAEDARLSRTVALKILRAPHRDDTSLLSRFRREARVLARLKHPGIGAIHAVEEWKGRPVLALEFLPGLTLAQRLQDGSMPVSEALPCALRLSEAVASAHAAGVLHRDLKPSNIKLTPDGEVKVLDFGLAKGFGPAIDVNDSRSMLGSFEGTMHGTILGTASYMSPEQARCEPLDARTDAWSFGCVLYEMLTGRQAFPGKTLSDTIAAVLEKEPDWTLLPADTPPRIRRLLTWCLRKDAERRLACLGDVAGEIILAQNPLSDEKVPEAIGPLPGASAVERSTGRSLARLFTGVLLGIGAGLAWWMLMMGGGAVERMPPMPHRLLSLPLSAAHPAVPGEGPGLAFAAANGDSFLYRSLEGSGATLYLSSLSHPDPRRIPGTEGVVDATFADTEGWVALQARGAWWKVPTAGGTPTRVVASTGPGADWAGGRLIFAPTSRSGLDLIGTDGRGRRSVTRLDHARGEISHRWPAFTPDGRHAVFCISRKEDATFALSELALVALDGDRMQRLGVFGSHPRVANNSLLVFAREGRLLAVPLDVETGTLSGPERVVAENVAEESHTGAAHYAVSRDGTAVYVPGSSSTRGVTLHRLGEEGGARKQPVSLGTLRHAAISAGGRIAGVSSDPAARLLIGTAGKTDLVLVPDVSGVVGRPAWSPDGQTVAVSMEGSQGTTLALVAATGDGAVRTLLPPGPERRPEAFTPDGSRLIYSERSEHTGLDLMTVSLDGSAEPVALRATPSEESGARPSPDGHWLAYVSHASGADEVYLQRLAGGRERVQVSPRGGCCPVWSASGLRLWFLHGSELLTVSIASEDPVSLVPAETLASLPDGNLLDAAAVADQLWFVQADPGLQAGELKFITGLGEQEIEP